MLLVLITGVVIMASFAVNPPIQGLGISVEALSWSLLMLNLVLLWMVLMLLLMVTMTYVVA